MPHGRSHIRGFLRHLHVQNGRGCSKTFETFILQAFCGRYYVKRKRNEADTLFDALNSCHTNIKVTLDKTLKGFWIPR